MKDRVYRISKVFKPVDYIEELTPEEEVKRDLEKYYADNFERIRDFTENFDYKTDTVKFTLYKTLYQTGETAVVDIKDYCVFKMEQQYMFFDSDNSDTVYSYIIEKLMIIMYAMSCYRTSGIHYTSVTPIFPVECGINPEEYTGISAEIVKNVNGETPDILTVVYIPDVSKYDELVCCGFTDTGHLCCPDIFLENYVQNDDKNIAGNSLSISASIILDDTRIRYLDISNICTQLCNFLNCVNDSSAKGNKRNCFSEYGITPMDTLHELLKIVPEEKFIKHRDDLFDVCSVIDQNSNIMRLLKYLNEYEDKIFNTDTNIINCLITAINVSNYYGIDLQEMFDYYKASLCKDSDNKDSDSERKHIYVTDLINYILPFIIQSFRYKEYLNKNGQKIREQLKNLADCICMSLRIDTVNLNYNFYVPVEFTDSITTIIRGKETFYKMWDYDKQSWRLYMSAYGYKPALKI